MKWSLYGKGIHFTGCAIVLLSNTKSKIPPLLCVVYLERCIKWKYFNFPKYVYHGTLVTLVRMVSE